MLKLKSIYEHLESHLNEAKGTVKIVTDAKEIKKLLRDEDISNDSTMVLKNGKIVIFAYGNKDRHKRVDAIVAANNTGEKLTVVNGYEFAEYEDGDENTFVLV